MTVKVVINVCHGGFSISRRCANLMAELGSSHAREMIEWPITSEWYGYLGYDYPRHCKLLVAAVEKLGTQSASGQCSSLEVIELKGDKYIIKQYEGIETVLEPRDIRWISVAEVNNITEEQQLTMELKV